MMLLGVTQFLTPPPHTHTQINKTVFCRLNQRLIRVFAISWEGDARILVPGDRKTEGGCLSFWGVVWHGQGEAGKVAPPSCGHPPHRPSEGTLGRWAVG